MYYCIFTSPATQQKELFLENKYSENSYPHKGIMSWESKAKGLLDDQDSRIKFYCTTCSWNQPTLLLKSQGFFHRKNTQSCNSWLYKQKCSTNHMFLWLMGMLLSVRQWHPGVALIWIWHPLHLASWNQVLHKKRMAPAWESLHPNLT